MLESRIPMSEFKSLLLSHKSLQLRKETQSWLWCSCLQRSHAVTRPLAQPGGGVTFSNPPPRELTTVLNKSQEV